MATCSRCRAEKPAEAFHSGRNNGVQSYCKQCKNEYRRERRAARGPVERAPRPKQPIHVVQLKHVHGLTPEDKRFMWITQGGRCAVCATATSSERGMHVDHDHDADCACKRNRTCDVCRRGLLCGLCNRMLGMAHDSTYTLRAGANYLESYA